MFKFFFFFSYGTPTPEKKNVCSAGTDYCEQLPEVSLKNILFQNLRHVH